MAAKKYLVIFYVLLVSILPYISAVPQLTVDCIAPAKNGMYTVYFGYNNTESQTFQTNISTNHFHPQPSHRGQLFSLKPGVHSKAFCVVFDGNNLIWEVSGETATANSDFVQDYEESCKNLPHIKCYDEPATSYVKEFVLIGGSTVVVGIGMYMFKRKKQSPSI